MRRYYRVMLGEKSKYAEECFAGSFIAAGFIHDQDLTGQLPDQWRAFNKVFIPVYLASHPSKTKISAGLACGMLWTVCKGIRKGDIVLCPDGSGRYRVGELASDDYLYVAGEPLPHRRSVKWLSATIDRTDMSESLQNSTGSIGTVSNVSDYHEEIEKLIGGLKPPVLISTDETVENPSAFAMEKHLEEFLVQNWAHTDLGKEYSIYEDDNERVGQQYPTDVRTGCRRLWLIS